MKAVYSRAWRWTHNSENLCCVARTPEDWWCLWRFHHHRVRNGSHGSRVLWLSFQCKSSQVPRGVLLRKVPKTCTSWCTSGFWRHSFTYGSWFIMWLVVVHGCRIMVTGLLSHHPDMDVFKIREAHGQHIFSALSTFSYRFAVRRRWGSPTFARS